MFIFQAIQLLTNHLIHLKKILKIHDNPGVHLQ